jgi:hypothetical protein
MTAPQVTPSERLSLALSYVKGQKRAEEALGFLAACERELAAARECEAWVPEVSARCVPHLADVCRLAVEPVLGEPPVASVRRSRRTSPDAADRMVDFLLFYGPASRGAMAEIYEPHEPVAYTSAEDTPFRAPDLSLAKARRAGTGSGLLIPLRSHGMHLGSFSMARGLDRPPVDASTFALAFELCRRVSMAVEVDRLHRELAELAADAALG